jgi:hypothetical protein
MIWKLHFIFREVLNFIYRICSAFNRLYIFMLKRLVKKKFKKRRDKKRRWWFYHKSVWLFLFPNFVISQKSKNSRMGKGKGLYERWTIRVKCGLIFLEFKGIHPMHINNLKNIFQSRVNIHIILATKRKVYYSLGGSFYNQRLLNKGNYFL